MKGPLKTALNAEDIDDIMDFTMVPWGQGTFITESCGPFVAGQTDSYVWGAFWDGYNATARQCYDNLCGADVNGERAADCFTGTPYCQHGGAECAVNAIQACARLASKDDDGKEDYTHYAPFAVCFEENYGDIQHPAGANANSTFAENRSFAEPVINTTAVTCASGTEIDPQTVLDCFYSSEKEQLTQMAQATIPHEFVPYVRVMECNKTWTLLDLGDGTPPNNILIDAVCQAACPNTEATEKCNRLPTPTPTPTPAPAATFTV